MAHSRRPLAFSLGSAAFAMLALLATAIAPPSARAQLSAESGSTTGSTCSGDDGDGFCGFSRQSQTANATTFTSRYAWNINADIGATSTRDSSGTAQHNLSFSATAVGGYRLDITTSRVGDMNRVSDIINCDGSADTSGITGSSNVALSSGSLSIGDPGSIGNGGGDTNSPFNQTSTPAVIFRESNGVAQGHQLTFTWSGSVRSNSCEAAVRQGEQNGSTTDCTACEYGGTPNRTQVTDGHFVTITFTSLCGNGTVESAAGEQCDQGSANGTSGSCCTSQCDFRAGGQVCRTSAGVCDPQETCSGSSGTCPGDALSPTTSVCRPTAGVCDVAENCTGSSAACPGNNFASTTVTCRPGAGVCDVAEKCTGSTAACPADAFASSATECRGAAGLCDIAENCTGSGPSCPTNAFASSGVCRGAVGLCDVAESCNGSGASCPADQVAVNGTECRGVAGVCDVAETCNGVATSCPADGFASSATECRSTAGVCDVAESCTGSGVNCPADTFLPSSTTCRSAADVCDAAESCTGSSAACPADAIDPAGTLCRGQADACDPEEFCDGSSMACPADIVAPDGDGDTVCDLLDNCESVANTGQTDADSDGEGDACDACTNVGGAQNATNRRIALQKVLLPTGDDKVTLRGQVTIPTTPPVNPTANGVRAILKNATGTTYFDVVIPGGVYSNATKTGWRTSPTNARWVYKNFFPGLANPIQGITISTSTRTPGVYKFTVRGKNGAWPVTVPGVPVYAALIIDQPTAETGQCAEVKFPAPSSCRFNRSFSSLTCK